MKIVYLNRFENVNYYEDYINTLMCILYKSEINFTNLI